MSDSAKAVKKAPGHTDLENLILSLSKLNKEIEISYKFDHQFDPQSLKQDLVTVSKAIHKEITKFSISFKPPNVIKESKAMCKNLLELFVQLNLVVRSIPKDVSTAFRKQLSDLVKITLGSTINLTNSFLPATLSAIENLPNLNVVTDVNEVTSSDKYEQLTGLVWLNCDKLAKYYKSSLELFCKSVDQTVLQLDDVFEEMEELFSKAEKKVKNCKADEQVENGCSDEDYSDSDFDDLNFDEENVLIIKNTLACIKLSGDLLKTVKQQFMKSYSSQTKDFISNEKYVDESLDLTKQIENNADEIGSLLWELDIDQAVPIVIRFLRQNLGILNITKEALKNEQTKKLETFKIDLTKLEATFNQDA